MALSHQSRSSTQHQSQTDVDTGKGYQRIVLQVVMPKERLERRTSIPPPLPNLASVDSEKITMTKVEKFPHQDRKLPFHPQLQPLPVETPKTFPSSSPVEFAEKEKFDDM